MKVTIGELKKLIKEEIVKLKHDEFGNLGRPQGSAPSSGAHINAALRKIWAQMKKDRTIDTIWAKAATDIQNAAGEDTPARTAAIESVKNHIQTVAAEMGNPPEMIDAIVELAVREVRAEGGEEYA
jgi:hypothetical protein